jgi:aryl carrier-like protein
MSGREGDTVDGRYRMLRVGLDSIEMAYLDGRGRQTIRLSGQ